MRALKYTMADVQNIRHIATLAGLVCLLWVLGGPSTGKMVGLIWFLVTVALLWSGYDYCVDVYEYNAKIALRTWIRASTDASDAAKRKALVDLESPERLAMSLGLVVRGPVVRKPVIRRTIAVEQGFQHELVFSESDWPDHSPLFDRGYEVPIYMFPTANVDGTPMLEGGCIDAKGHAFGQTD